MVRTSPGLVEKKGEPQMDNEARSPSEVVGHKRSLDAKKGCTT